MTHLTISIDFDGCADTEIRRKHIIIDVMTFLRHHTEITSITVIIGSLRQTLLIDRLNAIEHGKTNIDYFLSCKVIGELFLDTLKHNIALNFSERSISIDFNPLLMGDIFNYLNEGDTFRAMQHFFDHKKLTLEQMSRETHYIVKNCNETWVNILGINIAEDSKDNISDEEDETEQAWSDVYQDDEYDNTPANSAEFADCSKKSTIYTQMHALAKEDRCSVFRFYDDKFSILQRIQNYFSQNRHLIPRGTELTCVHHQDIFCRHIHAVPVYGTGRINKHYGATLFQIAANLDWETVKTIDDEINLEQNIQEAFEFVSEQFGLPVSDKKQDEFDEEDEEIIEILKNAISVGMTLFTGTEAKANYSQSTIDVVDSNTALEAHGHPYL